MSASVAAHPASAPASPAGAVARRQGLVRVYVWDLVVRSTHWLIALSLLFLAVTGVYIGRPFLSAPGEAGQHFLMGTAKVLHFYGAIVFTLAVLARVVWMFVGRGEARFSNFLPLSKLRLRGALQMAAWYMFLRKDPPFFLGHNPLAGATYVLVFGLYLVMITSGLGLYSMDAHYASWLGFGEVFLPLFGGAQLARWIHHIVTWLLLGFFVHHLYSALLVSWKEKNGTVESIVSGYKWVRREDLEP